MTANTLQARGWKTAVYIRRAIYNSEEDFTTFLKKFTISNLITYKITILLKGFFGLKSTVFN